MRCTSTGVKSDSVVWRKPLKNRKIAKDKNEAEILL